MDGLLQNRINPHSSPNSVDITTAKVTGGPKVVDSNDEEKTSFKDLLLNSNSDMMRSRAAMKNGDDLSAAKTDEEFFKMLSEQSEGKINPTGPKKELDKDAFMKLFITQLQNQDPLNPDDSAKMAAQLAQFQGLEQMTNVNKNLEKMSGDQASSRAVDLVGFVGKDIKLSGGRLKLEGGKLTDAYFDAPTAIANSYLEVRNGAGVVVSKQPLGAMDKGEHPVSWDGKDKTGQPSRDGIYTFAVVANDAEGQEVPVEITSTVKVTGIDMQEQGGSFFTELGKVGMHEVDSVGEQGYVGKAREARKSIESVKDEAEKAKADLLKNGPSSQVQSAPVPADDTAQVPLVPQVPVASAEELPPNQPVPAATSASATPSSYEEPDRDRDAHSS